MNKALISTSTVNELDFAVLVKQNHNLSYLPTDAMIYFDDYQRSQYYTDKCCATLVMQFELFASLMAKP